MVQSFLSNMIAFILSVPINLVIIGVICLFLKIFGKTIKTILRVFIGYFMICFLFAIFGLTLPSIPAIALWLKEVAIAFWGWLSSI